VSSEHLWTPEEHAVFLNRCEDLRLTCYHAIALDTGGRPGELLELKLGDVVIADYNGARSLKISVSFD
jgi:integrase